MEELEVKCHGCGIYTGEERIFKHHIKVGEHSLCPMSYKELKENGFIFIAQRANNIFEVMFKDGKIEMLSELKMNGLFNKILLN